MIQGTCPDERPPDGSSAGEQQQLCTLSATLRLSPGRWEAAFWDCAHMHAASRRSDWWATWLLLATDVLYFRWQLTLPRTLVFGLRMSHCALQLASTLTQLAFLAACCDSYPRCRGKALLVNRVFRLAIVTLLPIVCRTMYAANPTGTDPLTGAPITRLAAPHTRLTTLRDALFISGSIVAFKTVLLPLPWLHQLPTQALLLVPLLSLHLPVARAMLHTMLPPAMLQHLCQCINSGLDLLSVASLGGLAAANDTISPRHCEDHAPEILLLFAMLYIAFFLPV